MFKQFITDILVEEKNIPFNTFITIYLYGIDKSSKHSTNVLKKPAENRSIF